jgi:hypothetical protein
VQVRRLKENEERLEGRSKERRMNKKKRKKRVAGG